jgi:RNA polymerase sigma factor (sigma-70 family)
MEVEFDTLNNYYTIAKKTISSFGWKYYPSLVKEMLNNADTVSMVAEAIMVADWKWDSEKVGAVSGQSKSKYSYRNQRAIWAIQKYVTDKYKNSKKYEKNIEFVVKNHNIKVETDPAEIFEQKDTQENLSSDMRNLIEICDISDKQRQQLIMYYYEDKTLKQIGEEFQLTKEAVRLNIKKAISKLREMMGVTIES